MSGTVPDVPARHQGDQTLARPVELFDRRADRGGAWPIALLGSAGLVVGSAMSVLLIVLPVTAIVGRVLITGLQPSVLGRPIVLDALRLTALTSALTLVVALVLGTPLAWILARWCFPGRALINSIVELPMVLPPAVAGVGLLMAFGRRGLVGPVLEALGLTLSFTTAAVVLAQVFVAAPFYVRAARAGFLAVDPELEIVAQTLGVSRWATFWRVTVPVALPSLLGGATMCWARALGEFGATIMFAGSFQGRTQTMPLAIYAALESDFDAALILATILVVVSFVILFALRHLVGRLGGSLDA